ncbi:AmmeMemoRadiSam system protein A [Colwelliaceae bacterium 6471]
MPVSPRFELTANECQQLKHMIWQVLTFAVDNGTFKLPEKPSTENLNKIAATFTTLYCYERLRGCIGTTIATKPLWHDVCYHAYCSAFEDNRFSPLTKPELAHLSVDVSVLSEMIEFENRGEQALLNALEVGVDGLLLQQGGRSAIFLPSVWESLSTPKTFLQALKSKGGWSSDYWHMDIKLYRFTTTIFHFKYY